ncbi:MAG TPA: Obg family GTPase CgtA [Alphaproteobacteria bacterium]|jgi:GTP-binding protein|nr:Obg family GTPase CgtA [Alphaproteobacteria bacterium]
MLIDTAEITLRGGHGGAGMPKKVQGPDGGNGGRGGDVYLVGSSDLTLLNQFSEQDVFIAENGAMGARKNRTGKQGEDLTLYLPIGTSVIDKKTREIIFELDKVGQKILVCKGGRGGWGKVEPDKGEVGEEKKVILNLKLIADFGLIGLPNAGKSSLLNELTNAKAKTANYAFTTLEPNLGVLEGRYLADIPGLIEGASNGKGLGIGFLKHIEKVKILIHCIDASSNDYERDYQTIRNELGKYNKNLLAKKEIVILTKSDLVTTKPNFKHALLVSIHDSQSLEKLKTLLH